MAESLESKNLKSTMDRWEAVDWNLGGVLQDVEVMRAIGADLANSRRWPECKPGSEFAQVRAASNAARQYRSAPSKADRR